MTKDVRYIILSVAVACALIPAAAAQNPYVFDNFLPSPEALSVRSFAQDQRGLMWIGTNIGLFSYDGYHAHACFQYGDSANVPVNAILVCGDSLLLGSQSGLLVYNMRTNRYAPSPVHLNDEVQTVKQVDGVLWIGAMSGLYRYDIATATLTKASIGTATIVYSLFEHEGDIYLATYEGFGRYIPSTDQYLPIIPESGGAAQVFVNSIMKDSVKQCIWVGTGNNLIRYDLNDRSLTRIGGFSYIKTLCHDRDGNLVIGTDNGLYFYRNDSITHIRHDVRDQQSLSNNIVWALYSDMEHNLWIGTDYGISLLSGNRFLNFIPINNMTGQSEGNLFYNIFKDTHGELWLGGTNGLIRTTPPQMQDTRWFTVNGSDAYITHNHVRYIYEDRRNRLWITTDGGINRYDPAGRFVWHHISDSIGIRHSGWTYCMTQDRQGRYWLGTCMSGLLVIDEDGMNGAGQYHTANHVFTTSQGLQSNFISHICTDRRGNIWALNYKRGIDHINTATMTVEHIPLHEATGGAPPVLMLPDSEGNIWISFRGGIAKINPDDYHTEAVRFSGAPVEPLAMAEVDNRIWVSTSEGIRICDKQKLEVHYLSVLNKIFYSIYYDSSSHRVWLGAADGVAYISSAHTDDQPVHTQIYITGLYSNRSKTATDYRNGISASDTERISLPYFDNSFSVEVSDLNYTQEQHSAFIYRWGKDDETQWQAMRGNENILSFDNVPPGNYTLQISHLGADGLPQGMIKSLLVNISHPWYTSTWAKIIYAVFMLALLLWVANFFYMRQQLRIERIRREKTLEQSRLKQDFFTEIAHEFKTPLSLIIAPISQMLLKAKKKPEEEKNLSFIYRNAMKLTALVNQTLDFCRFDENNAAVGLIPSQVEFVGFARTVFHAHEESMKGKNVLFIFHTNTDRIVLNVDVSKMESALDNLLTNACKYTSDGDSIILSLNYDAVAHSLEIKLSDTGSGIPAHDLPFIFQRFYQASASDGKHREGAGIGLYLVKKFVELHGGAVGVTSGEGTGTSFTITLPVKESVTEGTGTAQELPPAVASDKPLVVVVDDNADMMEFIAHLLEPSYCCKTAPNGKAGLRLITDLLPDLVIADAMMPVMDGLTMVRKLKTNLPTATIPVILLTAKDDKNTELNSIHLNIDAYMTKPFDPTILLSRVRQLIANKRRMEQKIRVEIMTDPKPSPTPPTYSEKLLESVTHIIEDNLSDPDFNVNKLCEKTGEHQKALYRLVKQQTGMSCVEYIRTVRLKKAALLLAGRKFTVSEVMYMVGFSNTSYFAKCFQKHFGVSPGQY